MRSFNLSPSSSRGDAPPPGQAVGRNEPVSSALLATRILIVEDEVMIAWMVESLLEEAGFTDIEIASTRDRACASAALSAPGLLIADINLGGGPDGVDTAAQIKGSGSLPVLFVTAYADDATRSRVSRVVPGAAVVRKPIQAETLCKAVLQALRAHRAQ